MTERNVEIVALVGSLRRESINRRLAQLAADKAPEGTSVTIVEGLGKLAFYSEDDDPSVESGAALPAGVAELREAVAAADAVLLVTPEYNGTMPAVLKNAIDWLSRPFGAGALSGKPVGVIGAALGRYAGTWSREDTRKSVKIAGGHVVEEVEFGIQSANLTDDGFADPDVVAGVLGALGRLLDEVSVNA
ncbi:NAD(P)H-dependent oxidoreductase [Gordonia sp. PKS22-38]|uniref:NAD(P)H-dependent oxidoreductase n=1 Tax=Gordonia prachuapensis TaxID=3115651 RepID=A0ABU7MWW6_9ACTN|nr:NAD(P)H-dependent oxidoreductase [Gordonia sp. PKS22-38]